MRPALCVLLALPLSATALAQPPRDGEPIHPLVGSWDVTVVAGHKNEPDGTATPIMSPGVFTFSTAGDSLVVTMQVALSPSRTPIRIATIATSDTATFVRIAKSLTAVKGEQNVLSESRMVSTFRFVAVGDSLRGTMQSVTDARSTSWPVAGKRRTTP